jgi:protein O-mannosyl-transferase
VKKGQIKKVIPKKTIPAKQSDRRNYFNLIGLISISFLGVIIYSNSFTCAFQIDDQWIIVNNAHIRNLADIKSWLNFFPTRPVAVFSFALNYHYNKLDIQYYHYINILIHLINTYLVLWLTLLIFSSAAIKKTELARYKKAIALFVALLFVSHPLANQAVTYISQRMTSMAAMFYLLSMVLYIHARINVNGNIPKIIWYVASFIAGILAFYTKEYTFTLPFAIVMFEFFFIRTTKLTINFKDYKFYLFIAGFLILFTFLIFTFSFSIFKPLPPVNGHIYTVTPTNYLLTQFSVIVKYIQLLFIPANQMFEYDFPVSNNFFEIQTLLCFLMLFSLFISAIFLYRKHRMISFGIFWFFLTLSIESSIIPLNDYINEYRTYLPSFGFFLVLSIVIYHLLREKHKFLAIALLVIIIGTNSVLTFERNKIWKDEFSLRNDNIKKAPNSARSFSSRGDLYLKQGQNDKAINDYSRATEINPDYFEAYYNRANAYSNLKDWDKAMADYTQVIRIKPTLSLAYANRGSAYGILGNFENAINDFNVAIKLNTSDAQNFYNRGYAYLNIGQFEKAINDFTSAIEIDPNLIIAYYYRGNVYLKLEKWNKAIADYSTVLEMEPDFELAITEREIAYKNLNISKHQ